ncbi:MAG: PRC-barrel domain-containing protein [Devosia sp.]
MRRLLAVSALTLLLAPTSFAQDALPLLTATEVERSGLTAPTVLSQGYVNASSDTLVSKLLDETVFTSTADDAESIGTINDLVISPGVGISAVILGVGGFLGVGTKDVAVDFTQLEWALRDDGSRRWVMATTAEALTSAPAFIWADSEEMTGKPALTPAEEQEQMLDGDPNATAVDPSLTTDQPDRQDQPSPIDRSGLASFDKTGLTAAEMLGIGVYGVDDQQIGSISDVLFNQDGSVDAVIVDVGGFLGMGAKPVAVAYENLTFSADTSSNRYLFLNATREQLEAQPAYNPDTYQAERSTQRLIFTP